MTLVRTLLTRDEKGHLHLNRSIAGARETSGPSSFHLLCLWVFSRGGLMADWLFALVLASYENTFVCGSIATSAAAAPQGKKRYLYGIYSLVYSIACAIWRDDDAPLGSLCWWGSARRA
jgi:hypothetical protein